VSSVTVVAVLTTGGAVSINISLIPVTLTGVGVYIISVLHDDTVGFNTSTGGVWVEVVIVAVLTVAEAFVVGVDVLEVVLAGDA